mmetsp:Transcript_35940/g.55218  ORF Transcript_35940/g.55218 Transcript_35940/m.55218 type:complete len:103 (+) Transcript_35940:179-487(+)
MERLRLQINELTRKIEMDAKKNVLSNVIKNPEGSTLLICIRDIEVLPRKDNIELREVAAPLFESLMYTITSHSEDAYDEGGETGADPSGQHFSSLDSTFDGK